MGIAQAGRRPAGLDIGGMMVADRSRSGADRRSGAAMQTGLVQGDLRGIDVKRRIGVSDPVLQVIADLAETGGGTYEQGSYLTFAPKDGFAVAVGGIVLPWDTDMPNRTQLTWALRQVTREFAQSFVGTWLHEGHVYVDAVKYFGADRRDAAVLAGRQTGQMAIFDFATGEAVTL